MSLRWVQQKLSEEQNFPIRFRSARKLLTECPLQVSRETIALENKRSHCMRSKLRKILCFPYVLRKVRNYCHAVTQIVLIRQRHVLILRDAIFLSVTEILKD